MSHWFYDSDLEIHWLYDVNQEIRWLNDSDSVIHCLYNSQRDSLTTLFRFSNLLSL